MSAPYDCCSDSGAPLLLFLGVVTSFIIMIIGIVYLAKNHPKKFEFFFGGLAGFIVGMVWLFVLGDMNSRALEWCRRHPQRCPPRR